MGTNVIDAFFVTLGLDSSDFEKKAGEVGDISKKTGVRTKKAFGDMEDQGKALGQTFRTVRNEALGLFLAFSGASSLTSFITGMLTGTASADRFGQTVGMATGRVVAWRQAMKEIGGNEGSADAALGGIEKAIQSFKKTGSTGMDADFIGLGINRSDFMTKDPGQILQKIADAKGHMDAPNYADRLQRIGMPQDMTYFLMQGGDAVKKLIGSYEKNAKHYEEQAKAAENLQKTLAELSATIANKLVPPVTKIAEWLNNLLGGLSGLGDAPPPASGRSHVWGIPGLFEIQSYGGAPAQSGAAAGGAGGGKVLRGKAGHDWLEAMAESYLVGKGKTPAQARGIIGAFVAESGGGFLDPNAVNRKSGAYGIEQVLGGRKKALFARYGNHPTLSQQLDFALWELAGHDPGGKSVSAQTTDYGTGLAMIRDFLRPQGKNFEHPGDYIGDLRRTHDYIAKSRGRSVNIGHITVHTKATDAHGVARGIHHALKKRGIVMQADGGVAP